MNKREAERFFALGAAAMAGDRRGDTHTTNINVEMVDPSIEKGARFLQEAEEKAAARIAKAMVVDIPSIDAKLVNYEAYKRHEDLGVIHHLVFKINGHVYDIVIEHSEFENFAKVLTKKLTEVLLVQIPPSAFRFLVNR